MLNPQARKIHCFPRLTGDYEGHIFWTFELTRISQSNTLTNIALDI